MTWMAGVLATKDVQLAPHAVASGFMEYAMQEYLSWKLENCGLVKDENIN